MTDPKPALSTSGQETLEEIPGYTKCVADCGTYTINSHLNEFGLCQDCLLADYRKLRSHSPAVQALESQPQTELIDWVRERLDNCLRIAETKHGNDKAGWDEDAAYFGKILQILKRNLPAPPVESLSKAKAQEE